MGQIKALLQALLLSLVRFKRTSCSDIGEREIGQKLELFDRKFGSSTKLLELFPGFDCVLAVPGHNFTAIPSIWTL